jgi:hypothetical protein
MTHELAGYEYSHAHDLAGREAYVFRASCGEEKTVAWGEGSLTLAPAAKVRVVDRAGSESFVLDGAAGDWDGVQDGSVTVMLSAEPVFLSVDG